MPVRDVIHSSEVSTIFARSSFVITRSGTQHPRPVIETGRPLVRPIMLYGRSSLFASGCHGKDQSAADGHLAADRRTHLALPDRPAHRHDLALQVERLAGLDQALEANVVDAAEEGD